MSCTDHVCLTCSDAAETVSIVKILEDGLATVDSGSEISIELVQVRPGDRVLVHAGVAIAVLP